MNLEKHIQVFEYDHLSLLDRPDEFKTALDAFYGEKGVPYYSLTRNGVRFCNWVGALQVGQYTIEVLPKIDRQTKDSDKGVWQNVLIQMLRQSGVFQTDAPTESSLNLKHNSILDLYFDLFLNECEYLLNRGLIKRYRKEEGNKTALKGALIFGKHISQNLVHKERFYVRHTVYDAQHQLNQILLKTIRLIHQISTAPSLKCRVGSLLLSFPELSDIKVSDAIFDRIKHDRKSSHYEKAINIARLLLMNYHPDISKARNNVLALMFDMNKLWEKWVYRQMAKAVAATNLGFEVKGQASDIFWTPDKGYSKTLRPDIILSNGTKNIIIDTKWKVPSDDRPSDDDLKQMFSYNLLFKSSHSILLYPGKSDSYSGKYFSTNGECEVRFLDVLEENNCITYKGIFDLLNTLL